MDDAIPLHQTREPKIILASTSIYRGELLGKLKIPFEQVDPAYQESARTGESPRKMALRLALGKAQSAVSRIESHSPFIVIGCDQVAHLGAQVFGKPGSFEAASRQLATCSGNWVSFTTAICLIDERGRSHQAAECYRIKFRSLAPQEITAYLDIDQPFDCAGSIKAESAGITLLEGAKGRDINTLYGLPLMLLQESLASFGWQLDTLRYDHN